MKPATDDQRSARNAIRENLLDLRHPRWTKPSDLLTALCAATRDESFALAEQAADWTLPEAMVLGFEVGFAAARLTANSDDQSGARMALRLAVVMAKLLNDPEIDALFRRAYDDN